jgi:uncharacterized protein YjbJ (UPF0337 family)
MGMLSFIRQIFGVMSGDQGEVAVSIRYTGGHAMNADQLKDKWMQFKGELKQQWGKFTDEDLHRIEGNYEEFVGKVQERYADNNVALMKWADAWHAMSAMKPVGEGE